MKPDYQLLAHRLASALDEVLPYAVSRGEDLIGHKRAGNEDPAFPGADAATVICETADRLLGECREHGLLLAPVADIGDGLASALRNYATAPGIVEAYGQDLADRAADALRAFDNARASGPEHGGVRLVMSGALREYMQKPDIRERYGRIYAEPARLALQGFDQEELGGRTPLPLRVDPIGVAKHVMRHLLDESPGSYGEHFQSAANEGAAALVEDALNAMGMDSAPRMDDRLGEIFDEAHAMLEAATADNTPAP